MSEVKQEINDETVKRIAKMAAAADQVFGAPVTNPAQSEEQFKFDMNKDVEDNVRSHPKQLLSAIEEVHERMLEHGEDLGNLWTFVTGLRHQIAEIERILKKHWGDQTEQWRDGNE